MVDQPQLSTRVLREDKHRLGTVYRTTDGGTNYASTNEGMAPWHTCGTWQLHTHAKPLRKLHLEFITAKNQTTTTTTPHGDMYHRASEMPCVSSGNTLYISRTGAFPKELFLVSASSDRITCFCCSQSVVVLVFFSPKLAWLKTSPSQDFTMTQNLWGKFSKVKGQAGAWFPLTTSTLLLHVLWNISPDWLCKCLWKGNPAGTCCSQYAHRDVRNFCSELPNMLWISASLQIRISSQVCQKVSKDLRIFLQTQPKLWPQVNAMRKTCGYCFFSRPSNSWQFGSKLTSWTQNVRQEQ